MPVAVKCAALNLSKARGSADSGTGCVSESRSARPSLSPQWLGWSPPNRSTLLLSIQQQFWLYELQMPYRMYGLVLSRRFELGATTVHMPVLSGWEPSHGPMHTSTSPFISSLSGLPGA